MDDEVPKKRVPSQQEILILIQFNFYYNLSLFFANDTESEERRSKTSKKGADESSGREREKSDPRHAASKRGRLKCD